MRHQNGSERDKKKKSWKVEDQLSERDHHFPRDCSAKDTRVAPGVTLQGTQDEELSKIRTLGQNHKAGIHF